MQHYVAPRFRLSKDFDPSRHPRVPAGSGRPSGRFTSGGGEESPPLVTSTTADDRALGIEKIAVTRENAPVFNGQLLGQAVADFERGLPDGQVRSARDLIRFIIEDGADGDVHSELRLDKDGTIMSGAEYHINGNSVKVELLGSLEKGEGTQWISDIEHFAKESGADRIELSALLQAVKFYQHVGFRKNGPKLNGLQPMRKILSQKADTPQTSADDYEDIGALAMNERVAAAMQAAGTFDATTGEFRFKSIDAAAPISLDYRLLLTGPLRITSDYRDTGAEGWAAALARQSR